MSAITIPKPLTDDQDYFQILLDSQMSAGKTVHLTLTANKMSRTAPDILGITWLTGGGANYDDWSKPQMNIVNSATGVSGGPNFDDTYDILLDDLPKDPSGVYRVLKIPFLNPADGTESLAGSGHLTITIDAAAVMQINTSGQTGGYAFALPSAATDGAGSSNYWDFVELNCATPASKNKSVCFCNTTNVDMFALGLAINGRQSDGKTKEFGPDLASGTPVTDILGTLDGLSSEYKAGLKKNAAGDFLRYQAPDLSFKAAAIALDTAITDGFNHYKTNPLKFSVGTTAYEATSDGSTLTFTEPTNFTVAKPTTLEVIASTGPLKTDKTAEINNALKYIDAALNRGVFSNTAAWVNKSDWYPTGTEFNEYANALHQKFVDDACYGFSYDDVPGPPLVTSAPAIATCTSMALVITNK